MGIMSKNTLTLLLSAVTAFVLGSNALAQTPHIKGKIDVGLKQGILKGNLCLSNLPKLESHSFILHRGLNIQSVNLGASRVAYNGFYNGTFKGEGVEYTLRTQLKSKAEICISYTGAFPVYEVDKGERSTEDWKGNIAFNGKVVRAAEQAKWYPIISNAKTGETWAEATYDIEVKCEECTSIYMNGSDPAKGTKSSFSSSVPRTLLLLAGEFNFTEAGGLYFVNGPVSEESAEVVRASAREIASFFESFLDYPYDDNPTFITFAAVSSRRQIDKTTWGFNTWPTIAFDGRMDFNTLIEDRGNGPQLSAQIRSTLGHEMAHYYFGTVLVPRGSHAWFFIESTAEYLAIKEIQKTQGQNVFENTLRNYYKAAARLPKIIPLNEVTETEQINGVYRYRLGPMLLVAMEEYIGEQNVRTLLGRIVKDKDGSIDYIKFREKALEIGAKEEDMTAFEVGCLETKLVYGCLKKWKSD